MIKELIKIQKKSAEEFDARINSIECPNKKAEVYFELGNLEFFKKCFDQSLQYFEKAQRLFSEAQNVINVASCLSKQAVTIYKQSPNRIIKAHTLLNDANYLINNIKTDDANQVRAQILHNHGIISFHERNYSEALNYYKKALKNTCKKNIEYAQILDSMSLFYLRSSNYHVAIKYLKESLAIKENSNNTLQLAETKIILGRYYISTENYEYAINELLDAAQIIKSYDDVLTMLRIHDELAKTYLIIKDFDNAKLHIDKAIGISKNHTNTPAFAYLSCTNANYHVENEEIEKAQQIINKYATPIFDTKSSTRGKALVKQIKAKIALKQNNIEESIENLHEAIEIYRSIKLHLEEAKSYFELAKVYKEANNPKMIVSSLLEALRIANSNELPLLTKKVEDFLYEIDSDEWANIINKTAKKEKLFEESKSLLETLDLLGTLADEGKPSQDPLLALLRLGRSIAAQTDINKLIEVIAEETKIALNADRCTVFLLDKESNELWSKVALGMGSQEIRFPANMGLAGHVATTGEAINIKDAYADSRFNKDIDKKTGYKTKTILCMPIRNINHEIVGVFQVLNKQMGKHFTTEDEDLLVAIGSSAGIALENGRLFHKQQVMLEDQKKSFSSFINTLARSIDARDKITAGHSLRVTKYTAAISKQMGLSEEEVEIMEYAALLHDIGKIGIKDSVLCKEGKLTPEEYAHIQEHAQITHEILQQMYFTEQFKDVPEIASSHHEKYDGSGYFRKSNGENIHIGGRILAVSDVFDAITSKRHYRERMPIYNVLKILKSDSGTHFDSNIVDHFFSISTDRILDVLLTAYNKNLSSEERTYFNKHTIEDLFKTLEKDAEQRTVIEQKLIESFEKFYMNL